MRKAVKSSKALSNLIQLNQRRNILGLIMKPQLTLVVSQKKHNPDWRNVIIVKNSVLSTHTHPRVSKIEEGM